MIWAPLAHARCFSKYHYLNDKLGAGVRCFVAFYQSKPYAVKAVACKDELYGDKTK